MTPAKMASAVRAATEDWKYDVISIGYPGAAVHGRPISEPHHLGSGWVGFNFKKAFGRPVKIINERMLFLGLGTGLGSALIVENVLEPMELAHLPYRKGRGYEDYVGPGGLNRLGKKNWRHHVKEIVKQLKTALQADYVVLGGGNARLLKKLPADTRRGNNANAFKGGWRLWTKLYCRSTSERFAH